MREVVEVTPDYFSADEEEAVSTVSFSFEEIRRSPGAAGDVSRMLQMLPSTGIQTDQRNDLIVRGGSPVENLTVVDNIEIPSINHFSTQGASGGVIGMLNTDLIADVSFSAGGFSAEHGDRLSSVMVVTQREGNRSEFDGEISASMAGAGVLLEGPLAHGRGAWVLSREAQLPRSHCRCHWHRRRRPPIQQRAGYGDHRRGTDPPDSTAWLGRFRRLSRRRQGRRDHHQHAPVCRRRELALALERRRIRRDITRLHAERLPGERHGCSGGRDERAPAVRQRVPRGTGSAAQPMALSAAHRDRPHVGRDGPTFVQPRQHLRRS